MDESMRGFAQDVFRRGLLPPELLQALKAAAASDPLPVRARLGMVRLLTQVPSIILLLLAVGHHQDGF